MVNMCRESCLERERERERGSVYQKQKPNFFLLVFFFAQFL